MIEHVKLALRISLSNTAFDEEVQTLIDAARQDLILSGVSFNKANDDNDPLIKRAIVVYSKANFGYDNPEADRFQRSYEMLKAHLTLAGDYQDET